MIAVLHVDSAGIVTRACPRAVALLGPCVGRRCCDVLVVRASDRTVQCEPGCAEALARGARPARELRGVQVRETTCRVICGGAEGAVSVVLVTGDERRADGVVLSPRELEVIEGVAEGRSDKEIADGLGVEPSTVKTLLSRARTKLGARTRAEAVALAVRSELIR